jgi:drug/metabolite transporter (DMT)-like permease
MSLRDTLNLIALGALWGASFLFIRVAAPEFGPIALMEVRVVLACAVLLPLVFARRALPEIAANWRPIALMGVLHYALPFCLYAYSMLTLTGGFSAIINASSTLFAGIMAWILLRERLSPPRILGLVIGFAGVVVLVWDKLTIGSGPMFLAVAASVLAAFFYGYAAVLARKQLSGVSPIAVSSGSMVSAALVLLPGAIWLWPETTPTVAGWSMASALGVFCTAIAFLMYFRLIANVGPTRAITVAYLIPVFAVVFGTVFVGETINLTMVIGGIIVLMGTSLSTGLISPSGLLPRLQIPQREGA